MYRTRGLWRRYPSFGVAALSRYVDQYNICLLFGWFSVAGLAFAPYQNAFALLNRRYLAPRRWRPPVKVPHVFRFVHCDVHRCLAGLAKQRLPPLLKTYLMMGGWVRDHTVMDHAMGTLHVFTGVELGTIFLTHASGACAPFHRLVITLH